MSETFEPPPRDQWSDAATGYFGHFDDAALAELLRNPLHREIWDSLSGPGFMATTKPKTQAVLDHDKLAEMDPATRLTVADAYERVRLAEIGAIAPDLDAAATVAPFLKPADEGGR